MRVLIVEDDSSVAQSLELMLKSERFNPYITDLGHEAVELAKIYDYDIILLDLNLPDMSGYDVLRSLRVGKVKTPVLILSGFAGIEDKVRALGVGADDYVTKPFHKDELIARIHAIVRRSMGHAEPTLKCGDLTVKPEAKQAEIAGKTVPLTGKEYGMLELLAMRQRPYDHKRDVPQPALRRHGRAGAEDHRRVHLQAPQKARRGFRREELYRDRLGRGYALREPDEQRLAG